LGQRRSTARERLRGWPIRLAMGAHLIQSDPPCSPSGEESEARLKLEGLFNRLYDELRVRVSLYLRRIGLSPEDAE
jgi:hypothetical protein